MAWIIEENKLDAQQRNFLDNVDINRKNVWIKGFAGSGKSILLAYTAKKSPCKIAFCKHFIDCIHTIIG